MDLVRTSEPVTSRSDLLRVAAAGVLWGTGGLAGALLDRDAGLSPTAVAACRLVVGLIPAAPAGLSFAADPSSIALVAYLGLAPTALAYLLYFGGLRTVDAGPAALIALLEPLTAAVLGALVLGDRLGAVGILGGLLIGVAVLLCRRE